MTDSKIVVLVISWTLAGAFIFMVVATCCSLVGWLKFADPSQQKTLVRVLLVQAACIGVATWQKYLDFSISGATDYIKQQTVFEYMKKYLDPAAIGVARRAKQESVYDHWKTFEMHSIPTIPKPAAFPSQYFYEFDDPTVGAEHLEHVKGIIIYDPKTNVYMESSQRLSYPIYIHYFRPVAVDPTFITVFDDSRNYALRLPMQSGMAYFSGKDWKGTYGEFHKVEVIDLDLAK